MTEPYKIKVMLVDDSSIVRSLMERALKEATNIEIVGTAVNGAEALQKIPQLQPDIVLLDIEMPVMDGLTALPQILKLSPGTRVIMASTLSQRNAEISLRALALGATDYVPKPSASGNAEVQQFYSDLRNKIMALGPRAGAVPAPPTVAPKPTQAPTVVSAAIPAATPVPPTLASGVATDVGAIPRAQAIAIASSTGGPQALLQIFNALKGQSLSVPIFITQHMPPTFTTILADHITKAVGSDCHEGKQGEEIKAGTIYLAPGDYHMTIERSGIGAKIMLNQNPPENFCRPSADPMLRSLAAVYGKGLVTFVLTGMGSDGSIAAAEVVKQGGTVVAQSEATCVVYGMPKAVTEAKLVRAILPLDQMASGFQKAMRG